LESSYQLEFEEIRARMIEIKDVVVLGANGTMGAGSGEVFAGGGCDVVFLARSAEKAHEGLVAAQNMAKSQRIADRISVGTYSQDLEEAVAKADLIFEPLTEDIELKKTFSARVAIVTDDKPAFCGNRIGFKVLNEAAILAETHGVAFIDYLIGPHTGRAMSPLATIDLVGWDVHKAIVDNIYEHTRDEAHKLF